MTTTYPPTQQQPNSRYGSGSQGAARTLQKQSNGEKLASLLGWVSIGLGAAETFAPDTVTRLIGARPSTRSRNLMRVLGARELLAGVGILSKPRSADWVRSRVAGDAMDIALLINTLRSSNVKKDRATVATLAVLGVTALDMRATRALESGLGSRNGSDSRRGIKVAKSVTVMRPLEEVYAFWHDFENFPRFMRHLEKVQNLGGGRSRWKARAPAGTTVEWEAVIIQDVVNDIIAWESVEAAEVRNWGSVRFRKAPGDRGTEVHVQLRYDPPGGRVGAAIAKLFHREPGQEIQDDLRAFKQLLETGEITQSDASIHRGMHPAQPSRNPRKAGDFVSIRDYSTSGPGRDE